MKYFINTQKVLTLSVLFVPVPSFQEKKAGTFVVEGKKLAST